MAIIKNGFIRGRVGNVVYKVVDGKSVVTSLPRRNKENFEPQEQHGKFALAIKISSRFYRQLKEFNLNLVSSDLYNKLTSFFVTRHSSFMIDEQTFEWKKIGESSDLPMTKKIRPRHMLGSDPTMTIEDGTCSIFIPHFELRFFSSNHYRMPQGVVSMQNAVAIFHYDFESESAVPIYHWESERYNLGLYDRSSSFVLTPPLVDNAGKLLEDGLLLAVFNIRTYAHHESMAYLNNKNFNPSVIMGVWARE